MLKDICVTGGFVNAYKAVEIASKTKGKKKMNSDSGKNSGNEKNVRKKAAIP
jgi:hypothetical protein